MSWLKKGQHETVTTRHEMPEAAAMIIFFCSDFLFAFMAFQAATGLACSGMEPNSSYGQTSSSIVISSLLSEN